MSGNRDLRIVSVEAHPTSFRVTQGVTLGIGRAVKRDAVLVKVVTEGGLVGWGEAHHGRCPGAIAKLIDTTLRGLVVGFDASDVVGVWNAVYQKQLASHGVGAAAAIGLSGIDQALWDIRGKAAGWPVYKLLGGTSKPIPAYAGGISLGFQEPEALAEEARALCAQGYRALKLRFGDSVERDIPRLVAVREALGPGVRIMVDANSAYTVDDVRRVMPALDAFDVSWLEEPFPAHDYRSYREARSFGSTPLAAGENHYTRYEFDRVIEDGAIRILQPDVSKSGGITEVQRIAAMASAYKVQIHPHTSATGLNMSASLHVLSAIDNGGYFEADVAKENLFRDELTSRPDLLDAEGCVRAPDAPGLGLEVDEKFLKAHPLIEGPGYV